MHLHLDSTATDLTHPVFRHTGRNNRSFTGSFDAVSPSQRYRIAILCAYHKMPTIGLHRTRHSMSLSMGVNAGLDREQTWDDSRAHKQVMRLQPQHGHTPQPTLHFDVSALLATVMILCYTLHPRRSACSGGALDKAIRNSNGQDYALALAAGSASAVGGVQRPSANDHTNRTDEA